MDNYDKPINIRAWEEQLWRALESWLILSLNNLIITWLGFLISMNMRKKNRSIKQEILIIMYSIINQNNEKKNFRY